MKKRLCLIFLTIVVIILTPISTIHTSVPVGLTEQDYKKIANKRQYDLFKEQLSFMESSHRYYVTSRSGTYLGKYQFGPSALHDVGIEYNRDTFLSSPDLQEKALYLYLIENKKNLTYEIKMFEGEIINDILITENGLLASAHLVGAKNVKRFLYSFGRTVPRDGNGTSMTEYLEEFSRYYFDINTL